MSTYEPFVHYADQFGPEYVAAMYEWDKALCESFDADTDTGEYQRTAQNVAEDIEASYYNTASDHYNY